MSLFGKKNVKETPSKRAYSVRKGYPESVLKQLEDLYAFLTIAPDEEGFTPTNAEQINAHCKMSTSLIATIRREGILKRVKIGNKRNEGEKFKYTWNAGYPTLRMANAVIERNRSIDSEEDTERIKLIALFKKEKEQEQNEIADLSEAESVEVTVNNLPEIKDRIVDTEEIIPSRTDFINYGRKGDILTVNINMSVFEGITDQNIISAIMSEFSQR